MRIWVIGKSGIVAQALFNALQNRNILFYATSRKEVDICNIKSIRTWYRQFRPTHTINAAAYTAVDRAEEEITQAYSINVQGVENIARVIQEEKGRFLHISTDYIFSGKNKDGYTEEDIAIPQNIYGKTKYEGEKKIQIYLPGCTILRTSWVISSNNTNFFTTMRRLMMEKEEISIVSDQIGKPTLVKDLAEAVIFLLEQEGIFHFANKGETTWFDLAKEIHYCLQSVTKLRCTKIIPISSCDYEVRAFRPKYSVLNTQKIENYGLEIRHWKRGLTELLC